MPPGLQVVTTDEDGIIGIGDKVGVIGSGPLGAPRPGASQDTVGVTGIGTVGVSGLGDSVGVSGTGNFGVSGHGTFAVHGQGDVIGVIGSAASGPGVFGTSKDIGVSGLGAIGVSGAGGTAGVHGWSATDGVFGESSSTSLSHAGVRGTGAHVGVLGEGGPSVGQSGMGVVGQAGPNGDKAGVGVWGEADTAGGPAFGVVGNSSDPNGYAVYSQGNCYVFGDFWVGGGSKSAVVKLRNGEHRVLYSMESPECWFEDFGRARLVRGTARVRLDRTFAEVIRADDYHVFLSPEGLSHGLYVSRRSRDGFEVREQHAGKSTVSFSYRIAARRRDVEAPRFKRVKPPAPLKSSRPVKAKRPERPKLPEVPRVAQPPQLDTVFKRLAATKPTRGTPGRPRSRAR